MDQRKSYREEVAQEIIRLIEQGTAPWQKPWKAGTLGVAPFNPATGNAYRGINNVWLTIAPYSDPRWMTFNQASGMGARIRKGEKSRAIEYWQFFEERKVKDETGHMITETVELERPKVFMARVFNGEQMEGLEPYVAPAPTFDPIERAEALLKGINVPILHDQQDEAYYTPQRDSIHLPARAAFPDAGAYYATALHEAGHATGHKNRLARPFGPFASEIYAREELRAEIGSFMLCRDLGLPFDPGQHASYVNSWVKALKEHKNEIFAAARDADEIRQWITDPERRPQLERIAQGRTKEPRSLVQKGTDKVKSFVNGLSRQQTPEPVPQNQAPPVAAATPARELERENDMKKPSPERQYIAVPFSQKDQAKKLGAKWDSREKSWYVPNDLDQTLFSRWTGKKPDTAVAVSPETEFAQALSEAGLRLDKAPVMDGQWHRVSVEGDRKGQESGSYRYFPDEFPAGNITNYKTGETIKWVATGQILDPTVRAQIQQDAAQVKADRAAAIEEKFDQTARTAYGLWKNAPDARPDTSPYLAKKGVQAHGVKVGKDGDLLVPLRDGAGKLWNIQITRETEKRYLAGRKRGVFHVVEKSGQGKLSSLKGEKTILIAEGYATAATLHEITGHPVVVAFDAGNLLPVSQEVRKAYPEAALILCADNDHANKLGNVGLNKATEAALEVRGWVLTPSLNEAEKTLGLTDFNDVAQSRGREQVAGFVRDKIDNMMARTTAPTPAQEAAPQPHKTTREKPTGQGQAMEMGL